MAGQIYVQTGWVVTDLDDAVKRWVSMGVGPFFVLRQVTADPFSIGGEPAILDIAVGLAQAGGIQIELIQPNDDRPSPYRETYLAGGGFHHFAARVDNLTSALEERRSHGAVVAQGTSMDMSFAYLDTRPSMGCMTELMEVGPQVDGLFKMIGDASVDWDGSEPVRRLG